MAALAFALSRLTAALFFLATWAYGVTTYSPFAFDMFVRPQLFAPLTTFVTWHHALYWIAFAASAATLVPDIRAPRRQAARWTAIGFIVVFAGVGLFLLANPYLATLATGSRSAWVVPGALLPLLWLAVIDWLSAPPANAARRPVVMGPPQLLRACLSTAITVWLVHTLVAASKGGLPSGTASSTTVLVWGLALDLVLMLVVYALLMAISALAALTSRPAVWENRFAIAAAAVGITEYWRRLVLPVFSFDAADAARIAFGLGIVTATSWSGWRARRRPDADASTISHLMAIPALRPGAAALTIILTCISATLLTAAVETVDWAYLLHSTIALVETAVVLGVFLGMANTAAIDQWTGMTTAAPALLALALIYALPAGQTRLAAATGAGQLTPMVVIDRLASIDPLASFAASRLIRQPAFDLEYFEALIASETSQAVLHPAAPVAAPSPAIGAAAAPPNVFIFAIDSLRRDYLSVYNPAVTFTPSIDAWARESFVFSNAFTPYGGTWLAMPSLWSGGPVTRGWGAVFGDINVLDRGVTAAGYDFVINDFTVANLLRPGVHRTFLDPDIPSVNTDLCRNVESLTDYLSRRDASRPVFAFLAPMNVHILNTGINSTQDEGRYPGFYPPYATRLERVDACFGAFISDLKRRDLYDNSVIVLTSDHGDALGDHNRWGHQFYLFPETIRIPLIVHLPRSQRDSRTTDLARVTLLTDVAPTILDAIGQPVPSQPGHGIPLFVPVDGEPGQRGRDSYLLMSSYGSTYALLRRNGRQLYISDLRSWREYGFSLYDEPLGAPLAVDGALRRVAQRLILERVADVEALYRR